MSETIEGTPGPLVAGNTNANLAGIDRDEAAAAAQESAPSASDLDAVATEAQIAANTAPVADVADDDDPFDEENTFDVSRREFHELRDAFLRLVARIEKHNIGAPHKI